MKYIFFVPDSKEIYMFEVNRNQTDVKLDVYDATTGEKIKTLYTEHSDKYVEPQNPVFFLPWDSSKFLMFSQKDGYKHLYLMNTRGEMLKQITKGKFVVLDMLGFCEKTKSVIITTNELHPMPGMSPVGTPWVRFSVIQMSNCSTSVMPALRYSSIL